ncbi:MAG: hypothetical protein D6802_08310 [Ardenticatenia bacterium]|nr:MAG: hypothetical protein D6802_08310 [Ardenticatenia bacterium]
MSEVVLRFYQAKDLGKPGSLEAILDTLQALGLPPDSVQIGSSLVTESIVWWDHYDENVRRQLGVAYKHRHLNILVVQDQSDEYNQLVFRLDLKWEHDRVGSPVKTRIYLSTLDAWMFNEAKYPREYYAQLMLRLGKALYTILHPVFGSIDFCSNRTREKDVQVLEIPHIYWANFFGPEYVEKYGKEYFLKAPGWLHEELDDGGILYVLAPVMARRVKGYKALTEEVKAHFGVESVRCKKKRRSKERKGG